MGHINRRLKLRTTSGRLSLPTGFLREHSLDMGDSIHIWAPRPGAFTIFTPATRRMLAAVAPLLASHALEPVLTNLHTVLLRSQGRLILPRELRRWTSNTTVELQWKLDAGILILTSPETQLLDIDRPSFPPAVGPGIEEGDARASSDIIDDQARGPGADNGPLAARPGPKRSPLPDGLTPPGPVRQVRLNAIRGRDPDLEPDSCDDALAEDIAAFGIIQPIVLAGTVPYDVVDGRKRLDVAQFIGMKEVPAVVLRSISRRDIPGLRYLLASTSDRWSAARRIETVGRQYREGVSIQELCRLLRKGKRTVQRYLRVADHPELVARIRAGEMSVQEAEKQLEGRVAGSG